jgi:mitochondrial fission protein ELM1
MIEGADNTACWVVTPGHAGMENQAVALAEAVGLDFTVKRVKPRPPWTWLPPGWWPAPLKALDHKSDPISPPWPKLLISCGRRAVPYSLYVRSASGGATKTVHIQNPQTDLRDFDLIVPPAHDHLKGPNVFETAGSLHRVNRALLDREAAKFAGQLGHLPRPLIAVLIGGSNSYYKMTPAVMEKLANQLSELTRTGGYGLLVTPSRRTGEANIKALRAALAGTPAVIWDFAGDNPYFGFLGLADSILVTCDSVNMISEACATGKPVHVIELDGGSRKFDEFHGNMAARGLTRPFTGAIENWRYEALDDLTPAAEKVRELLPA